MNSENEDAGPVVYVGPNRYQLCGGPQDGGCVIVYEPLPLKIFVKAEWQGDGNSSWGRVRSDRFPLRYSLDSSREKYNLASFAEQIEV